MRNAQKLAMMAIFAAMHEEEEAETRLTTGPVDKRPQPLVEPARQIQVDLLALARGKMKTPA
jgi:hypothetical protein